MRATFAGLGVLLICAFAGPAFAASTPVDTQTVNTLSGLLTASLSEQPSLDVLASSDVREVVALESDKQAMGCESETDCLAEVAGAMGARLVVFGQLGRLGTLYVLTLNLFDSESARAVSRVVVQADSIEAFPAKLGPATAKLVAAIPAPAEGEQWKVLVMDLKPTAAGDVPPPAAEPSPVVEETGSMLGTTLLISGIGLAGGGALAFVGGLVAGGIAVGAESEARDAQFHDEAVDAANRATNAALAGYALVGVGGAVLLVGGAVAGASFVVGE